MTCTDTWYAWPILVDGVSYFNLAGRYHPLHLEFDSKMLTPVTRDNCSITCCRF